MRKSYLKFDVRFGVKSMSQSDTSDSISISKRFNSHSKKSISKLEVYSILIHWLI